MDEELSGKNVRRSWSQTTMLEPRLLRKCDRLVLFWSCLGTCSIRRRLCSSGGMILRISVAGIKHLGLNTWTWTFLSISANILLCCCVVGRKTLGCGSQSHSFPAALSLGGAIWVLPPTHSINISAAYVIRGTQTSGQFGIPIIRKRKKGYFNSRFLARLRGNQWLAQERNTFAIKSTTPSNPDLNLCVYSIIWHGYH